MNSLTNQTIEPLLAPRLRDLYCDLKTAATKGTYALRLQCNAMTTKQQHDMSFLYPALFKIAQFYDNQPEKRL